MNLVERIGSASWWPQAAATAGLLVALGAGLGLRGLIPDPLDAERASAGLMAGALVLASLVARCSPFPRWSLVTAAGVLGAGLIVPTLVLTDAEQLGSHAISNGTYAWLFLMMLGGTRSVRPRWCHSPWVLVAVATVVSVGLGITQFLG